MTPSYSSHTLPRQQQAWHTYSPQKTLELLETTLQTGLNAETVSQRQQHYGPNEIEETAGRSNWEILLDQFTNIMLIMLIVVAIISGILDVVELQKNGITEGVIPFKDTIAIFLIVILNGLLGYLQETRAEKALAALKRLSSPKVQVIRDGKRLEVDAPQLVPGDIILVEAGDQLCADGQILEASNLQIRESALTGEAQSVNKYPLTEALEEDTPIGDRRNMVFTGTEVIQGRGRVVVTNTGMTTELGKIAEMLQSVESEPTPLQRRMSHLGNVLVSGSLIFVALVVVGGVIKGGWGLLQDLVEISLSMAVAVVPEGLPAVITVTLALGTQRMVKRHALIRKLPAVETLGSVNVICSDKTGTLTQNKMVVQEVETLEGNCRVTGTGYEPLGDFIKGDNQTVKINNYGELQALLFTGVLCNDAHLSQKEGDWAIMGDPTEGALLALSGKAGLQQSTLENQYERVAEFPFSSERKRMSTICEWSETGNHWPSWQLRQNHAYAMFTKGSPELILERCQSYQLGEQIYPLTEEQRKQVLDGNNAMAKRALRVLGFAYKPLEHIPDTDAETSEQGLIWLGLVGMMDAPRPEVRAAVAKCRAAGIRPIVITGDHQLTAQAIAQQLGIVEEGDHFLTGRELERMSQPELEQEVERVSVYARVSPEHKLRIVRALQKQGKFVAMTGDGVNDAPALKQADIGIAMGITGTDVSKEASDMVLLDDNFATIVAATEEGRVVYSNIRHFIKYILGSNVGEVITIAAAPIMGLSGIPLIPLQILWMNLVTDGLPALALAVEPADPHIMERPPFNPDESIFARGLGSYIVRIGIIFAIITITLMAWAFNDSQKPGHDPESWKTMVFTTLCIAQMGHAIAARSTTRLAIEMNPFSNIYLWGAVIVTTILQLMLVYVAPLRDFFNTTVLTREQLVICLLFSSLMFVWVEFEKILLRLYRKFVQK
ncbi:cation-translocating P-type ATPase [Crocosphaera sp. UHCC 0190]|uniref:cation-translocating P-type ATPase n=1 Tax=Crocosphaera sp. UHCC 0190 TaxID=3110246 RepID=UPI002B1FD22E|nr:cation-translocating P-type ATPase [Crocosphaera sp. UHCC 0190]MEA5511333.1 cation-translocating P-type ATPase [Crocosphaera sp. UHCC 0190]